MNKLKHVLIIGGPTGSGKTGVSLAVAKKLNGEIISADSVQIYRGMDIGTAKIKTEEMNGIPHHLLDCVAPSSYYSVANFQQDALKHIDTIHAQNHLPIIVGGTGLYINSLLYDYDFNQTPPNIELRRSIEQKYIQEGIEALVNSLHEIQPYDPNLDYQNPRRVMRALEVALTGKETNRANKTGRKNYAFYCFVLNKNREQLYNDINQRVEVMFHQGLLNEAKELYNLKLAKDLPSQKAIGYKEIFEYFDGNIDLDEAKEKIKRNTRQYAKRQLTWFRNQGDFQWINVESFNGINAIAEEIINRFKEASKWSPI